MLYSIWQVENDYCLLLALPCGRDQEDVLGQTQALKSGFITYLQAKQAAGIINVPNPGSNQVCSCKQFVFCHFYSKVFYLYAIIICVPLYDFYLWIHSQLMWCRFSHRANSQRATSHAWHRTFSTASPAFPLTS